MQRAEGVRGIRVDGLPEAYSITFSLGAAMAAANEATLDALIERTDRALYQAKEAGRNCSVVADELASQGS